VKYLRFEIQVESGGLMTVWRERRASGRWWGRDVLFNGVLRVGMAGFVDGGRYRYGGCTLDWLETAALVGAGGMRRNVS
jgi:hypothetical protein